MSRVLLVFVSFMLSLAWPGAACGAGSLLEPPPVARHKLPPPPAPEVPALYLRGDFNDWGTRDAMQRVEATRWMIELDLAPGRKEFKLADAQWRDVDLGGSSADPVATGRWIPLHGQGQNMPLDVPSAGRYRFELQMPAARRPQVRVERLP